MVHGDSVTKVYVGRNACVKMPRRLNVRSGKNVLMLSYIFPPFYSAGGSIRVVKFVKYLPSFGWTPVILTIGDDDEYETMRRVGSETLLSDIPDAAKIHRIGGGEPTLKFLSWERRFGQRGPFNAALVGVVGAARRWLFRNVCLPDRYLAWLPTCLIHGIGIIAQEGIDVIFATTPPHSSALIGALLGHLTGKPLVLDFRDDWIDTPRYRARSRAVRWIERRLEAWAVRSCEWVVLVTDSSRESFVRRYPKQGQDKFVLIPNGCDLEDFGAPDESADEGKVRSFRIVHAGQLSESKIWRRSPRAFFDALGLIRRDYPEIFGNIDVIFTGQLPDNYRRLAEEMGIKEIVRELGHLPRDQYVRLLKTADVLLAINYSGFATLVPGKMYEYWAAGGPPILLLSCEGTAQALVEKHGLGFVVEPDEAAPIESTLLYLIRERQRGRPVRINSDGVQAYDRRSLTGRLARALDSLVG
jgi:glycosyltransferase involved in cell wall biosynthesis